MKVDIEIIGYPLTEEERTDRSLVLKTYSEEVRESLEGYGFQIRFEEYGDEDQDYDEDLGWIVTASPDGTLTDGDGREYEYLFWEGDLRIKPDLSRGFCVKGEDTAGFLEDALAQLGLTDKEADAFIMFWLPQLESNKYNVITFQTEPYEDAASLEITPAPDTVIRVNMLWYPVNSYVDMEAQDLEALNPDVREGFTVVEWGGEKYERGVLGFLAR